MKKIKYIACAFCAIVGIVLLVSSWGRQSSLSPSKPEHGGGKEMNLNKPEPNPITAPKRSSKSFKRQKNSMDEDYLIAKLREALAEEEIDIKISKLKSLKIPVWFLNAMLKNANKTYDAEKWREFLFDLLVRWTDLKRNPQEALKWLMNYNLNGDFNQIIEQLLGFYIGKLKARSSERASSSWFRADLLNWKKLLLDIKMYPDNNFKNALLDTLKPYEDPETELDEILKQGKFPGCELDLILYTWFCFEPELANEWFCRSLSDFYDKYNLCDIVFAETILFDPSNLKSCLAGLEPLEQKQKDRMLSKIIISILDLMQSLPTNDPTNKIDFLSLDEFFETHELINDPKLKQRVCSQICIKYHKPNYLLEHLDETFDLWERIDNKNSINGGLFFIASKAKPEDLPGVFEIVDHFYLDKDRNLGRKFHILHLMSRIDEKLNVCAEMFAEIARKKEAPKEGTRMYRAYRSCAGAIALELMRRSPDSVIEWFERNVELTPKDKQNIIDDIAAELKRYDGKPIPKPRYTKGM